MTEYEIKRLCDRIKELTEENTELKAEVERLKLNEQLAINNGKLLLKENAELKEKYRKRGEVICRLEKQIRLYIHSDNLIKAKEIIKTLADDLSMYSGNYQKELLEARQFLEG